MAKGSWRGQGAATRHRRVSESEERGCLPPPPRGRKRWTKKRQPDGRGAKGEESKIGKEPKGAGGWGLASQRAGREQGQMPGGHGGTLPALRRGPGAGGGAGSPGASLPRRAGAGAAEPERRGSSGEREGPLSLAPTWADRAEPREIIPIINNSRCHSRRACGALGTGRNFGGGVSRDPSGSQCATFHLLARVRDEETEPQRG